MKDCNWDEVQQGLIDQIVGISKHVRAAASKDIVERLVKAGIPSNKIEVSKNNRSIVAKVATQNEYLAGKIYFDQVMKDIEQDMTWAGKL